jgi:hypothetical protein
VDTGYLDFSVILKVEHGGHFLRNALASALRLDWPSDSFEIIVVGPNKEKDAKRQVQAASHGNAAIRYLSSPAVTYAGMLNSACASARGLILAFADDDCEMAPDWLRNIADAFDTIPNAGIIGGPDELCATTDAFSLALDCVLGSFVGTGGCRKIGGLQIGRTYPKLQNMAIQREIAERVAKDRGRDGFPLFDDHLTVHEDVDLTGRVEKLGMRAVMCPSVRIRHCRDTTSWRFLKRDFMKARSAKLLGVHRLPHMILVSLGLGALLLAVGAVWSEILGIVFGVGLTIYAALILWCALKGFFRTRRGAAVVLIPFLLVGVHIARALGYALPVRRNK